MRQIFLDTETTGLSAEGGDRIIEIGCIEMLDRRLTGSTKHFYLNPERRNSDEAVQIHGLTDEFLSDKPLFAAVVDELLEYVRGAEIVIHNAAFDVGFLNAELRRLGRPKFIEHVGGVLDSWVMARDLFPGKSNSLDALCKRLEVDNSNRALHGALLDAGLLAEVYIRMTRGQHSLVVEEEEVPVVQAIIVTDIDLSELEALVVIEADADEQVAHEALLSLLDKSSGGQTTWRRSMT